MVGTTPYPADWEDEGPIPIETFFYRCDECGYDMRGLEHTDICPECGYNMREAA
jgi:rubrerythrin